jgi:hypothetical protein
MGESYGRVMFGVLEDDLGFSCPDEDGWWAWFEDEIIKKLPGGCVDVVDGPDEASFKFSLTYEADPIVFGLRLETLEYGMVFDLREEEESIRLAAKAWQVIQAMLKEGAGYTLPDGRLLFVHDE